MPSKIRYHALQGIFEDVITYTQPFPMADALFTKHVIEREQYMKIKSSDANTIEAARTLFMCIFSISDDKFDVFLQVLAQHYPDYARELRDSIENFTQHPNLIPANNTDVGSLPIEETGCLPMCHAEVACQTEETAAHIANLQEEITNLKQQLQRRRACPCCCDVSTSTYEPPAPRTNYKITVKTSNLHGAGTDANVYVRLFGENVDSGDLHLKKSETNKDPFETNRTDIFKLNNILQIDPLLRCRVWHDNRGIGSAWHLHSILVQDKHSKRKWNFSSGKWLSLTDQDKIISRDLISDDVRLQEDQVETGLTTYEIEVVTGVKREAGMMQNAWLTLEGQVGTSEAFLMKNLPDEDSNFGRGQTDTFTMRSENLGELQRLFLGAVERDDKRLGSVTGREAKWHCYAIYVRDTKSGTYYVFKVKTWINIHLDMAKDNSVEIKVSKVETDLSKASVRNRQLTVINYEVIVYTGSCMGAGTDANVSMTMYGKSAESGKIDLKRKGKNLFERKNVDRFPVECVDLGEIEKIRIEHDDTGPCSDWFLDRVGIKNVLTGVTWNFPCADWLSSKKGDARLWKTLNHD